jgi:hypothetical protein
VEEERGVNREESASEPEEVGEGYSVDFGDLEGLGSGSRLVDDNGLSLLLVDQQSQGLMLRTVGQVPSLVLAALLAQVSHLPGLAGLPEVSVLQGMLADEDELAGLGVGLVDCHQLFLALHAVVLLDGLGLGVLI